MVMTRFLNRNAWHIESDQLCVTVLQCGAHVAETTWKETGINPLWIQDRPTIDSDQYNPSLHAELYGNDSEGKFISGLLGHNLCLPFWGYPSQAEYRSGMTCHGETNIVRWQQNLHMPDRLDLQAWLPESGLRVHRVLRCIGSTVCFDTTVQNNVAWDRPIAWCEHVTLGAPFLNPEDTGFVASLGLGVKIGGDTRIGLRWPEGRGEIPCNLLRFSSVPHTDLVNAFLVESHGEYGYFAAWNAKLGSIFGYVFRTAEFPWLNVWENNDRRRRTRGMEFSNTPIDGTMKQLIATPTLLGTPTFEWLDAKSQLNKRFFSFTFAVPSSYRGISAIEFDGLRLSVVESETGLRIATDVAGF